MASTLASASDPLPPDIKRGPTTLIICWIFLSLAIIIVSLRLIARGILRRTIGWDDYTILIALVCCLTGENFGPTYANTYF